MPRTGFLSSGTNSDDTVGTVGIPLAMTLPPGLTNWGVDQVFYLTIDESSTAQYGVDYKAREAMVTFHGSLPPSPYLIPLTVIRDSVPKTKTVVFTLKPGSSVATLGSLATYTYTIHNPPYPTGLSGVSLSNGMISFAITNLTSIATNYVLRCHDLVSGPWTTSHIFTGVSGQHSWSEVWSNDWTRVFYRVISE
jgi:hypothetical protein